MLQDDYLKEFETILKGLTAKLREELQAVRSSRPSVELVERLVANYYDQLTPINQLGSISIVPPRTIQISVWDKNAVGPVMKAIENAKIGLTASNEENNIRATLPPLTDERREEFSKLVRKNGENYRIQVRHFRDEVIKKVKAAEEKKELNEDDVFRMKEKIQKAVDGINKEIETLLEKKLKELSE